MKKSGLILLTSTLLMLVTLLPVQAAVNASPALFSEKMEAEHTMVSTNKKRKGFKKRKSTKILGIFKRKPDCGCPKHK